MSTITIKDANYRIIGHIETMSDGTQVAKDVEVIGLLVVMTLRPMLRRMLLIGLWLEGIRWRDC